MDIIKIKDKEYYLANEVYKTEPTSFVGCSKTSRQIIINKKLKKEDYLFMKYIKSKNEWEDSDESYKLAKLLISKTWVHNNLKKFKNKDDNNPIIDTNIVECAPSILELEENEKFVDIDGNKLNIEVRGEKEINSIYFKVKDISEQFKILNVLNTISKTTSSFTKNLHYKLFNSNTLDNVQGNPNKLYLTFKGLTKLLYVSHSKNAEHFQDWANKILFTVHLGNQEDKEILSSELLGVNAKTIKDVFKTNSSKTPCVYLYMIANAKELLTGDYNDDDILCKYGCTDDLERRCSEHHRKYKKDFNTNIELLCFSIIESKYIFDAETNITQYFKSNIIEYNNTKELIIINKKDISQIKQHYKMIQNSYIGRYEEMQNKIIQLEKDIIELNNKLILQSKEIELINEKHKNELKDKDIELLNYKIKLLEK